MEPSFPYNILRFSKLGFDFHRNCDSNLSAYITHETCAKHLEMPLENLTGNDLTWAAWTPGELVQQVQFGNTVVNYSITDKFFEHWTLEFVDNLPQWKLIPPPTSKASDTLTIISRKDLKFPQCQGRFENGTKCGFSIFFCSNYDMKICCNSSCHYEKFVRIYNERTNQYQFEKFHIESINDEYGTKRITGKSKVSRTNTYIEYYTKDTDLDDEDNLDNCRMKCYIEIAKQFDCTVLTKLTLNEPLSSNCYVNQSMHLKSIKEKYESLCSNKCSNSKRESFWRLIRESGTFNSGHKKIHLENDGIKTLFPIESYSFVQLLSDVGGSAGFFLEVAIMPLVIAVFSLGLKMFLNQSTHDKLRKFGMLFKLPLILCLGILLIRDLNEIFNINDEKYVGFVSRSCSEGLSCSNSATAHDWIASIFAQASLGCHAHQGIKSR